MLRAELETGGDQEANDRGSRSEARQGSDDVQQARGIVYERLLEFAPRRQTDGRVGGESALQPSQPALRRVSVPRVVRACVGRKEGRKESLSAVHRVCTTHRHRVLVHLVRHTRPPWFDRKTRPRL